MKNKVLCGLMALAISAIFSSCAKVPQADIDAANSVIDSARAAGAEMYVPEAFAAVQDSMSSIMEIIEAQKSKTFGNFNEAKEKLVAVTEQANLLFGQVETRKGELKVEIQTKLAELKTLLDENKKLIPQAPKGKEGAAALAEIKNELTTIETSLGEITSLFDSGDYYTASVKVNAAFDQASSINQELKDAIAKAKAAR